MDTHNNLSLSSNHPLVGAPKISFSFAEAELLTGVSRATLYRAIQSGELRSVRGGQLLRCDLEAFMEGRAQ
jgi:excisionase family DNA binding protein